MKAPFMLRGHTAALALATAFVGTHTLAGTALAVQATCYDFSDHEVGSAWLIEPQTTLPVGIGTIRVHPLKVDGIVQTLSVPRFEIIDTALAGGRLPEVAGTAVAIQLLPAEGVKRIALRYAHQAGDDERRAATVEVNGVQRDWRGSFEHLNHAHLGRAGHPARFTVTPAPLDAQGSWQRGLFVVESREPIRSFTIGAAALRLDDICIGR